jgi:hypothetical protein
MVEKKDINLITNLIKTNSKDKLKSDDLIYYLNSVTKNDKLKYTDVKGTVSYINKLILGSKYYDLYYNKTSYSSVRILYLFLLLPFYLNYPRLYNAKYSIFISFISIIVLIAQVKSNYDPFIKITLLYFIILFLLISIVFIFIFKKFDIVSIFIIFFLTTIIFNYIVRIVLPFLVKNIIPKKNKKKDFTVYNDNISNALNMLVQKETSIKITDNQQFYIFLTTFDISNSIVYKISDFVTNLFQPIIVIIILFCLGNILNGMANKDNIKLCPIIGIDNDRPYFNCNSNYILPDKIINDFNNETKENFIKVYKPKFMCDINGSNNDIKMVKLKVYEGIYGFQMNAMKNLEKSLSQPSENPLSPNDPSAPSAPNISLSVNDPSAQSAPETLINNPLLLNKSKKNNRTNRPIENPVEENNKVKAVMIGGATTTSYPPTLYGKIIGLISTWILIGRSILSPMYFSLLFSIKSSRDNIYKKYYDAIKNDSNIWSFVCMGTDLSYYENYIDSSYNKFMNNVNSGTKEQNMSLFNKEMVSSSNIFIKILRCILFFIYFFIFYTFNNVIFGTLFIPTFFNLIIAIVVMIILLLLFSKYRK